MMASRRYPYNYTKEEKVDAGEWRIDDKEKTEYLIYGYIRQRIDVMMDKCKTLLFQNIPSLVVNTCILYSQTTMMEIRVRTAEELRKKQGKR